jgi:ribose-phosphate pyrophosphokinase
MKIISGTTSKTIAENLSKSLKIEIVDTKIKRFPDGELYIRILEDIADQDIIVIQNTYPDLNIIELLLLQDAIREENAKKIITIIPYFGYARQDKIFEKGEVISAKTLAKLISINSDEIITIDPHKEHILDFFQIPASSCSAIYEISEYLKNKELDLILAPDKGAIDRAKEASKIINCDYDFIEKTRINGYKIEIKPKNFDIKNKNVAIIDDIISTGGTMAKSIKELKKQNVNKTYVACTHGLFVGTAIEKLISAKCDDIISTDTILSQFSKVRISKTLTSLIKSKYII